MYEYLDTLYNTFRSSIVYATRARELETHVNSELKTIIFKYVRSARLWHSVEVDTATTGTHRAPYTVLSFAYTHRHTMKMRSIYSRQIIVIIWKYIETEKEGEGEREGLVEMVCIHRSANEYAYDPLTYVCSIQRFSVKHFQIK